MALLQSIGEGIWTAALPLKMGLFDFGGRVTAVRLEDDGLLVHSPPKLTPELKAEVDALGPVQVCVAPNKYHHLFVRQWKEAYPEARIYAAPGLPEKRKSFAFDGVLGDEPEEAWRGVLEQHVLGGAPGIGEVVFFHPASRTLVATDLAMSFGGGNWPTRMFARLNGVYRRFGPSRFARFLIKDRAAARASLDHMLEWDFDRVLIAHGEPLETGGKEVFREAFDWV